MPTLGGQTGLNIATELWQAGIPQKYNMRLLGTSFESIQMAGYALREGKPVEAAQTHNGVGGRLRKYDIDVAAYRAARES